MASGERAPDPRETRNTAEFLARLQELKDWSGLTYRDLEARAEALGEVMPRSTVANMLSRATLPREELLVAFVRACGVPSAAREDWRAVRNELAARGVYGGAARQEEAEAAPAESGARTEAAVADPRAGGGTEPHGEPRAETPAASRAGTRPGSPAEDVVWPVAPREAGDGAAAGARARIRRGLVAAVAVAGLVLAAVSVVAFLRGGDAAHPPPAAEVLTGPAAGDVRIRVIGPDHERTQTPARGQDLCLGERRGSRSGQIHQLPCAEAGVPLYSLKPEDQGRWRIVSHHPDYGPGCSGLPSGGRVPDAAFEDSECGDPSRVESFALEPYGTPVRGYRIVPAGSATPRSCVTVVGDRTAPWARLAQAPCAPDAAGQLFSFDRRDEGGDG